MPKREPTTSIPPPGVVRFVAAILLLIDIALIAIITLNFSTMDGTFAVTTLILVVTSIYFPIKALRAGQPEWILLDLIIPY